MKKLGGLVCLCSILLVGTMLVPILSEAAPSLTINNTGGTGSTTLTVGNGLELNGANCLGGDGVTHCYTITGTAGTGRTINDWKLADVSSTNRARILINDKNTSGAVDSVKLTGIKITPVLTGTTSVSIVINNTFNVTTPQGLPRGNLVWGMSQNGYFDPLSTTDSANGNRLINNADATVTPFVNLGKIDTGVIANALTNVNKSVTSTLSATTRYVDCNTNASGRCIPSVTAKYSISITGGDTLVLNDSFIAAFGTCRENDDPPPNDSTDPTSPPTTVPNGPPDPLPPGPVCKGMESKVNTELNNDVKDALKAAKAAGATPAEKCTSACGNGTVVIIKQVDSGDPDGTFGFTANGDDIPGAFDITTSGGVGSQTFLKVSTGPLAGARTITESVVPLLPDPGDFWDLYDISCSNTGGENSTMYTLNRDDGESLIGVTINNLDDNDTLSCTFSNRVAGVD
ncbi:MAG: hypothetical protein NTNFB02_26820 [Nitrospira sp.]